jgi:tetratricopeptide (TPR) repeat protein
MRFPFSLASVAVGLFVFEAAFGQALPESETVVLPPYLVETAQKGVHWRYAQTPEFEIISRCADSTTRTLVGRYRRLHTLLERVLPQALQVKLDVPRALIVYDDEAFSATAKQMATEVRQASQSFSSPGSSYAFMRDQAIFDTDTMSFFVTIPKPPSPPDSGPRESVFEPLIAAQPLVKSEKTSFSPGYVSYLLTRRTPRPPSWFVSGFLSLYSSLTFDDDSIRADPIKWPAPEPAPLSGKSPPPLPLLPMKELLAGMSYRDNTEDAAKFRQWTAQAELFVRWGLDPDVSGRRESFWKFVQQASFRHAGEAEFIACFKIDFASAQAELITFLAKAKRTAPVWRSAGDPKGEKLVLRDATRGEVARLKGDWERLATNYARGKSLAETEFYLSETRRTLQRAYERGDRDPRLLASLGLCECEAGNDSAAQTYLDEATQRGVIRPRAYVEFARIRLQARQASPQGTANKLSAGQAGEVISLLQTASRQSPALPETFELLANTCRQTEFAPDPEDLALVERGLSLFPDRMELYYQVAEMYSALKRPADALRVTKAALDLASNETEHNRFMELRRGLETVRSP